MNAGEISDNTAATNGGGIATEAAASSGRPDIWTYLNAGLIQNNTAQYGGGMFNGAYADKFSMNGVTITENTASIQGGGVWSSSTQTNCDLTAGAVYNNQAGLGQDVFVLYNSGSRTSYINLIPAADMFAPEDGKTGIGWFDEGTEEIYDGKVQGRLQIRSYPLTLRYTENDKVVAMIGEKTFNSVQAAVKYIVEEYTGTDTPVIKMVDDSKESVTVPGGVDCVLNLNGHTLTGDGTSAITCSGGELEIIDEKADGDTNSGEGIGTITGTAAVLGGGVRVINGGSVKMSSGQISGCIAGNYTDSSVYGGGAVGVEDGSFELAGTASLNNNIARNGSAVSVVSSAGTFKMTGGVIENNTATGNGAVYIYTGSAMLTGGEIKKNTSNRGTVTVSGGTLNIAGSSSDKVQIHDNQVADRGAGIYMTGSSKGTLSNVEISNNRVTNARNTSDQTLSAGGGIFVDTGTMTIADGTEIHDNFAPRGGGVYINTGTVKMIDGSIHDNQAQIGGGVAQNYAKVSEFYMTGGLLAGNNSYLYSAGNDFYSAYEGTDAGRAAYLAENYKTHPDAYLVQASQMNDPRYNVWKDDTYDGNVDDDGHPTGVFVLVKTDGEGNTLPTAIGEGQLITIMINRSRDLQLTADYYPIQTEAVFDNDMEVAVLQVGIQSDGTATWDTATADTEISALEKLEAGEAQESSETYSYSSDPNETENYISYDGKLYERGEAVEWTPGNDASGGITTDKQGNRIDSNNRIVRTFDTVTYHLSLAVQPSVENQPARDRKIRYWIESELPYDSEEVEFVTENILSSGGNCVTMHGINDQGQKVQILRAYWDYELKLPEPQEGDPSGSGTSGGEGSGEGGSGSGTSGEGSGESEKLDSFTLERVMTISVKGMKNGDTIKPTFRAWVEGNEENKSNPPTVKPPKVTVSAAAKYNLTLEANSELAYTSYFDIVHGIELSEKEAQAINADPASAGQVVYGTMLGYGLTASLYNDGDKGLKGIELTASPLEFNVRMNGTLWLDGQQVMVTDGTGQEVPYGSGAYIWAYKENMKTGTGRSLGSAIDDRNMDWNDEDDVDKTTSYAYNAAPLNSGGNNYSCYSGGTWQMSGSQYVPNTDGDESTIHFTVRGFGFNYNSQPNCASDGVTSTYFNGGAIKPFSAGYLQVLFPFEKNVVTVQDLSYLSVEMHAVICDLKAESISGAPAVDYKGKGDGRDSMRQYFDYTDETMSPHDCSEMRYGDNYSGRTVGVYLAAGSGPGDGVTKINDFYGEKGGKLNTQISGDTGTGSTSLGPTSNVYIQGGVTWSSQEFRTDDKEKFPEYYIAPEDYNTQTDNLVERNYMTAMNLLQKFDADAFTPFGGNPVVNQKFTVNNYINGNNFYVYSSEANTTWTSEKTRTGNLTILYAAKPDGTNWTKVPSPKAVESGPHDVWAVTGDNTYDNDGGTADMDSYREEDLLYFTSLDDLHAHFDGGGVCVGFLYEFRDVCIRTGRTLGVYAKAAVTDEFERIGHTYETTNDVRCWSTYRHTYKEIYRANSAASNRADLLYTWSYLEVPLEGGGYGLVNPDHPTPTNDWHNKHIPTPRTGYVPESGNQRALWTDISAEKYQDGYIKSEYEKGTKVPGTHTGMQSGNNVVIYTLDSSISIENTDKGVASNTVKENYDVMKGERTANFKVRPSLNIASAAQNHALVTNGTQQTAIEITIELPEKLHYNDGTIRFDYVGSGYKAGELPWNVELRHKVGPNGIEQDILVLTTDVYDISRKLPTIAYSTTIGDPDFGQNDVNNGESLKTVTSIRAKYASINENAANTRTDQVTIKVIKNGLSAISKTVGDTLYEVGEDMTYILRLNNLDPEENTFRFGDVLPYNGDGRETSFTGAYRLEKIVLKFTDTKEYEAFLSTENPGYLKLSSGKKVSTKTGDMNDIFNDTQAKVVTEYAAAAYDNATFTITYTFADNSIRQNASATSGWALSGYFPYISPNKGTGVAPGAKLLVTITPMDATEEGENQLLVDPNPKANTSNKQTGNNIYSNTFFYSHHGVDPVISSAVKLATIDRRINGRVWLDTDINGLWEPLVGNDHPMQNVTVHVLQKDGNAWKQAVDIIGNPVEPMLTDKDGWYEIGYLAQGTYMVTFEDPNNTYWLGDMGTSPKKNPFPYERLSLSPLQEAAANGNKSIGVYNDLYKLTAFEQFETLKRGALNQVIVLPNKEGVKTSGGQYYSPNWNAALYYIEMPIRKVWDNMPVRIPKGSSVTLRVTGTGANNVSATRDFTLTQGTEELTVTSSDLLDASNSSTTQVRKDGTYETITTSKEEKLNGTNSYTWKVDGIRLQAKDSAGNITYSTEERSAFYSDTLYGKFAAATVSGQADSDGFTVTNAQKVYDFGFVKVNEKVNDDDSLKTLAGAEFQLTSNNDADNKQLITFSGGADGVYYRSDSGTVTTLTTNASGELRLKNLQTGVYCLWETKAPDGYDRPKGYWIVKIAEDGTITTSDQTDTGIPMNFFKEGENPEIESDLDLRLPNRELAKLTIQKLVTGNQGDRFKDFSFDVTIADLAGKTVKTVTNGENGTVTFDGSGKTSFTLKHNDSITITGIPIGAAFKVSEGDFSSLGYATTVEAIYKAKPSDQGQAAEVTTGNGNRDVAGSARKGETIVAYTNDRVGLIRAGIPMSLLLPMLLVLLGGGGCGIYAVRNRKKKKNSV